MLLDRYGGRATICQPGGIEVVVQCDYRVEQQQSRGVEGVVRWLGSYSEPVPEDTLDKNLDAELVLPDGRRGSILITSIFAARNSYDGAERGEFTGAGSPPSP